VVAEGTGTSDKAYYTLGPGAIGGIICRDENGTKYWYHYDRLGNVIGVTNAYGSVASLYTMDAFGNVLEKGNSGYLYEHTTDPQPYHLTTKEYDPDARLYYFGARWYDPEVGRFITRASRPPEIEHPYTLAMDNPGRFVDPTGEKGKKCPECLSKMVSPNGVTSGFCADWLPPGLINPLHLGQFCFREIPKRSFTWRDPLRPLHPDWGLHCCYDPRTGRLENEHFDRWQPVIGRTPVGMCVYDPLFVIPHNGGAVYDDLYCPWIYPGLEWCKNKAGDIIDWIRIKSTEMPVG